MLLLSFKKKSTSHKGSCGSICLFFKYIQSSDKQVYNWDADLRVLIKTWRIKDVCVCGERGSPSVYVESWVKFKTNLKS